MRLFHLAAMLVVLVMDRLSGASRTKPPRHGPIVRFVTKHPLFTAASAGAVLLFGAAVMVAAGIVPIRASSGHWPVTAWLLDTAKLQSVRTWSIRIEAPALDDERLVMRGAGHYALGCETCHGAPGSRVPPVFAAMTPPPPELTAEALARWTPSQLFYIVKHGIKFTGMPAWPAQTRDDEVWAVVAFLARMPQVDPAEYQRLIHAGSTPAAALPAAVRDVCSRCHGVDGMGRGGAFPRLAGQRAPYLEAALHAFASRSRFSGTMSEVAAALSDAELREAARYYAALPGGGPASGIGSSRGAAIATKGIPERDVPACVECHGPSAAPKNPAYPRLAGQQAWYLARQLELLRERQRGGSPRVNLMHPVVDRLEPADLPEVARYFASLPPDAAP
jgi:cytochrome c553